MELRGHWQRGRESGKANFQNFMTLAKSSQRLWGLPLTKLVGAGLSRPDKIIQTEDNEDNKEGIKTGFTGSTGSQNKINTASARIS